MAFEVSGIYWIGVEGVSVCTGAVWIRCELGLRVWIDKVTCGKGSLRFCAGN
jgi:hypothetical protein